MKLFAIIASTCLAAVALAGCTGGGGSTLSLAAPGGFDDELAITGIVVDEEFVPVEAATVSVKDFETSFKTDASGRFRIGPVEPGEYVITAEKMGYASATMALQVTGDALAPISLTLRALALNVPYHETIMQVTFVICASYNLIGGVPCTKLVDYATGTNISGTEKFAFTFKIPNPGLVDLLVEMVWKAQAYGRDMLFMIQTPPNQPLTAATVKYFAMSGGSPLRGWVVAGIKNAGRPGLFDAEPNKILYEALTIWSSNNSTIPTFSLYLNHRTETWMTFFYNRAGTRDFSVIPDR